MSSELINLDSKIRFLISVPDWRPEDATPFQGFALTLCENSHLLRFIQKMPTDLFELTPKFLPHLAARRMAGQSPITWHGQSPRALRSIPFPVHSAFSVIFLDRSEEIADYREWLSDCPGPVTIVADKGGTISYTDLTYDALRGRYLEVCNELKELGNVAGIEKIEAAIKSWTNPPQKEVSYGIKGHATIVPNVAALRICGYIDIVNGPLQDIEREQAYVDQIVLTANTIFDEREARPFSLANQIYPKQPDLNLYLPATYDIQAFNGRVGKIDRAMQRDIQTALRLMDRQSSYKFELKTESQMRVFVGRSSIELTNGAKPVTNPVISIRQRELWLGTEAMACLSSSEISAVVRLPNRLNRTRGIVRQFAQHYRADNPRILKRSEVFRGVQRAIANGFPNDLRTLLARSRDGIRIISDAHIEWLDVDGIPLGLRFNVSRIPVTPGNLFIETISAGAPVLTTFNQFQKVLVVSGLSDGDHIAKQFVYAFNQFGEQWRDKLTMQFIRVSSRQELIDAINSFDGMLMLFDGHGSHKPEQPGVLWLRDEAVNIWDLRGEITRAPPIVVLSACDTHAADRNHATVANGFLSLGSLSVLGSVFPLHATDAAIFAARLLYRVATFVPAAIELFERSLTWLEVVSGMLRRQLVTDILRHLETAGLIAEKDALELHIELCGKADILGGEAFVLIRQSLLDYGIPETTLDRETQAAIASSSTISYLHVGRPETIIINTEENIATWVSTNNTTGDETSSVV
ncbi:CHAT domain-containing protein [Agrobacterium tumefaciens]|uniref:CHAT domain-containing protein n=1 Tax=Agrobacterium tumefaciens TaxID=358 RepID=UPI001571C945|nr:hypothetical protein [Agrobacterium tumefaciens]NTD10785.1 hypothetical protein [Agrobacterium tumefaciens]